MAHVAFLWHMHQPYYVDSTKGTAVMPWVRLHCAKGYLDMIAVLGDYPGVHANFNLSPVLVLQIRELLEGRIVDEWLELSRKPAADLTEEERFQVLENFFKANWEHLVLPHPRYRELLHKRGLTFYRDDVRRGVRYFSTQELLDLQVWFNLTWCGYTACRLYPELAELKRKGRHFTEQEKQRVLDLHLELMGLVLERYREAEERGQIELTTTPYFHPILPLVYDSEFAERAMPGREFPRRFAWPQDAEAQLRLAVEQHAAIFGSVPRGLWPSEGSIAPELIPLMQSCGFEYFCSDEENLFASLKRDPAWRGVNVDHLELFQGWRVQYNGAEVNGVFRERPLSDFIGFTAAKNEAAQAAMHLLFHLRHISDLVSERGLIPIILDGENAWEFFRDGGECFLRALYSGLEHEQGRIKTARLGDYLRENPPQKHLTTLHTGSWIGSNLDIWIGEPEENRAWERLGESRAWFQQRLDAGLLSPDQEAAARKSLYAAEGSDWFWWYGPDFSTENDVLFDRLFRMHLRAVYTACGAVPPSTLDLPITQGRVDLLFEPPTGFVTPTIDGARPSFFEWSGAGRYEPHPDSPAGTRPTTHLSTLRFGHDQEHLYFTMDFALPPPGEIEIIFGVPDAVRIRTRPLDGRGPVAASLHLRDAEPLPVKAAYAEVFELEVPLAAMGLGPGARVEFQVRLNAGDLEVEVHPPASLIAFLLLAADWPLQNWTV
jgi:alpha-amylase/alpha-mannosidase (GH57 family)